MVKSSFTFSFSVSNKSVFSVWEDGWDFCYKLRTTKSHTSLSCNFTLKLRAQLHPEFVARWATSVMFFQWYGSTNHIEGRVGHWVLRHEYGALGWMCWCERWRTWLWKGQRLLGDIFQNKNIYALKNITTFAGSAVMCMDKHEFHINQ